MLGRKSYTREELDNGRAAVERQLAAYRRLRASHPGGGADHEDPSAVEEFEALFFNNLTLVIDRYFVHRLRSVTGKDGNPLNEVEMISDSLMNNNATLRDSNVIKYVPEQSVVKLRVGDQIRLTQADFERLSAAFFGELERRFR